MALRPCERTTDVVASHHFFINRAFGLLWSGQTISALGSHITGSGIPLIAILVLGAHPAQLGLLAALSALPGLLLGLFIGVWVDRLPRRSLLLLADLARALLLLSLPIAALGRLLHMEQLYIVTVLLSAFTVCFDTAYQAFLPQIVTSEQLVEGNSKLGTSSSLAEMGGPPLAGGLIQSIGAPLAVLFDALSFLVSAVSIGLIRSHEIQPGAPAEKREPVWREMHEGLQTLFGHPLLRTLAVHTTVRTFFGGAFAALYTIYIVRELSLAPAIYGMLVALGGFGALIGSLLVPRLTQRFGEKQTLLYGTLLHGLLALLTPLAAGPIPLLLAMLGISQLIGDIGFALCAINAISLRQSSIPAHVHGRVAAVMGFLVDGVAPLGAVLAGVVSESIGIRLTLLCGAGGMLLVAVWLMFALRKRRK
ncbi:MAG: MFS transporter [Chloroflexi bacterium]|nr:MFS transporter [Chloroflexota bacterium]